MQWAHTGQGARRASPSARDDLGQPLKKMDWTKQIPQPTSAATGHPGGHDTRGAEQGMPSTSSWTSNASEAPPEQKNLILSKIGHAHVRYNMHKTEQQTLWILVLAHSFIVLGYREDVRACKPPSTLGCK